MRTLFVGVGEAFDAERTNCSLLVRGETPAGPRFALLDCGFSVPFAYWRLAPELGLDPANLDLVWLSHLHGDHCFGLPALLLKFWEQGRTKPLAIAGGRGVAERARKLMDLAYGGVWDKFAFEVTFHEIASGEDSEVVGFTLGSALSGHGTPNHSLRISDGRASLFYSGDGRPTDATVELANGVNAVVHEAYGMETDTPGHGSVPGAVDFARAVGAGLLALVHVRSDVRRDQAAAIRACMEQAGDMAVLLPEQGEMFDI